MRVVSLDEDEDDELSRLRLRLRRCFDSEGLLRLRVPPSFDFEGLWRLRLPRSFEFEACCAYGRVGGGGFGTCALRPGSDESLPLLGSILTWLGNSSSIFCGGVIGLLLSEFDLRRGS